MRCQAPLCKGSSVDGEGLSYWALPSISRLREATEGLSCRAQTKASPARDRAATKPSPVGEGGPSKMVDEVSLQSHPRSFASLEDDT